MRGYYATRKHLRGFVFGTPEGWHTAVYDLTRKEWLPMDGFVYDARQHAKAAVEDRLRELLGGTPRPLTWH
jgi:hypothetical protein